MQKSLTLISGGQPGVDRGALDAAISEGITIDGWCPKGRLAEDGPIPEHYPLKELESGNYRARTRKNVEDSDGTVIIYNKTLEGGSELTVRFCMEINKPYLLLDASVFSKELAAGRILEFIRDSKQHPATTRMTNPAGNPTPELVTLVCSKRKVPKGT